MGGDVIDLILWDLLDSAKDIDESLQVFWPLLPWEFVLFRTVSNSCADSQHPLAHQKGPDLSDPDLRLCSFQSQMPSFNFISSETSRTWCQAGAASPKAPDCCQVKKKLRVFLVWGTDSGFLCLKTESETSHMWSEFWWKGRLGLEKRGRAGHYSDLSSSFSPR